MARNDGSVWFKWLIIIAIIALLAGGGIWFWQHPREKEVDFKTAPVTQGDVIQSVTATGQMNPITNVVVGSQVSGIIRVLNVDFNSRVTNKQVIAQLDPANYKAQVAQADGELASAKAALELAQTEQERSKTLYDSKIVAKSDFDSATAGLHQAEAQVKIKEAVLQQAQVNLAYTTIYAPVDGIVISRNVDVGQTVAASLSAPTLYIIANDLSKMQIDALVSEADIGGVETNQHVNFTVDAFPTRTFQGMVVQIRNSPQTNQNVITYDTVIAVDNSELKLRPGMTANVTIITAQQNNTLKIPNAALRFHPPEAVDVKKEAAVSADTNAAPQQTARVRRADGGGGGGGGGGGRPGGGGSGRPRGERSLSRTVYVLGKSPDGKDIAQPVQIKIGITDSVSTQVVDGLKEGDSVIIGQNTAATSENPAAGASNPFGGGNRMRGGGRF